MTRDYLKNSDIFDSIKNFKENSQSDWARCVQDLVKSKPIGTTSSIYSCSLKELMTLRVKKMYHQPRLTKPEPVPGTTLLRVDPHKPGDATIIWTLPNQENFGLYQYGKMFADQFVHECIDKFLHNPQELMKKEEGDLSESEIREFYKGKGKKRKNLIFKKN